MGWKYPKYSLQKEHVIDIAPINENFLSVVEETSGYLNEHNIRAYPVPDIGTPATPIFDYDNTTPTIQRDKLSRGGSMRLHVSQHNGAHPLDMGSDEDVVYVDTAGSVMPFWVQTKFARNWTDLKRSPTFQTFDGQVGLSKKFTAIGGKVWVCASINIHVHDPNRLGGTISGLSQTDDLTAAGYTMPTLGDLSLQKGFGFNVAIEVDGSIIYESLVGTGDISNEYLQTDEQTGGNITTPQGGGGINGAMIPVTTDAIVTLSPGEHTVRVAVQDILATNRSGKHPTAISGRSIFALELLR